jgi:hypothetical protein
MSKSKHSEAQIGALKQMGAGQRDPVYCATVLLDMLEKPARLRPTASRWRLQTGRGPIFSFKIRVIAFFVATIASSIDELFSTISSQSL